MPTPHILYIFVLESPVGVFSTLNAVRLLATTKPCPDINIFTFFGNTGDCVNLGATGMFQAAQIGALPTGVLKGTKWTVDWGDGTALWQYTSTADNDIPGIQMHTYPILLPVTVWVHGLSRIHAASLPMLQTSLWFMDAIYQLMGMDY